MSPESDISIYNLKYEKKSCETYQLWEEAGFIPPKKYLYFIELLHFSFLNGDEIVKTDILAGMTENITKSVLQSNDLFFISDPEKMYLFAQEMKIEIENADDTSIAAKITAGIIAEYMSCCDFYDFLKNVRKFDYSLN